MQMNNDYEDPFDSEKVPSLSFKDVQIGHSYTGTVVKRAELVQSRDYETGDPATWPDGKPKMSAVVTVEIDSERRSVWAQKPSSMFAALAEAQRAAGVKIEPGGTLTVRLVGEKPHENKRFNAIKQYSVTYTPPADALSDDTPPF